MSKGGGSPATTNTVTNNAPWSGAVPYINTGLQAASDLYGQGGPAYYPGQSYAGETSGQASGINALQNIQSSTPQLNTGLNTLSDYASGKYLSADNPYFGQMANTTTANVLPGINAQFANAGRGNSGLAARAAGQGLGDAIGGLAYNNYQQGLGQQQSAASNLVSSAPSIQNMGINAANANLLAGTTQQGLDQGSINDQMARYNYNAQLPYQNLQNYIANISGQIGGTGSSSSTQTAQPAQPSFWNQLLGGAAAVGSFFV